MPFTSLGLSPALLKALADQNFTLPTPIQQKVIPAILNNQDVLGIAKTGSGKTAGYVLPILMSAQNAVVSKSRHVQVLVLVPARELAEQVKEVFQSFSMQLPQRVKTLAVYGGVSINPQMMAMQGVQILIATPGRLLELVEMNAVNLSAIKTLVLDEADKMLNLGFKDEVDKILALLPEQRQNLLFSATLSDDINHINQLVLHEPVVIKIENEPEPTDQIIHIAYSVPDEKKGPLLRYLLKQKDLQQVLIFASSVHQADTVADKLRKNGVQAKAIHSKKSQGARTDALANFKAGKLRVLTATDLISRGIDINFLPCVINYELPRSPKDYIHRVGRTGRADAHGEAISFINAEEEHHFKVIQKKIGKVIPMINSDEIDLQGY